MRKILLKIWPGFLDLPKIWKSWVQTLSKVKLTTCFHEFSEYESTNFSYQILCNICFDFSYALNWIRKKPCLTHKEFVFIFNWKILEKKFVDLYSENSWKHVVSSITFNGTSVWLCSISQGCLGRTVWPSPYYHKHDITSMSKACHCTSCK